MTRDENRDGLPPVKPILNYGRAAAYGLAAALISLQTTLDDNYRAAVDAPYQWPSR